MFLTLTYEMALLKVLFPLEILSQVFGILYLRSNNKVIRIAAISYTLFYIITHLSVIIYCAFMPNNPMIYFEIETTVNIKAEIRQKFKLLQLYESQILNSLVVLLAIANYPYISKFRQIINTVEAKLELTAGKLDSRDLKFKVYVTLFTYLLLHIFTTRIINTRISRKNLSVTLVLFRTSHSLVMVFNLVHFYGYLLICTKLAKVLNKLM